MNNYENCFYVATVVGKVTKLKLTIHKIVLILFLRTLNLPRVVIGVQVGKLV